MWFYFDQNKNLHNIEVHKGVGDNGRCVTLHTLWKFMDLKERERERERERAREREREREEDEDERKDKG